MSVCIGAVHKPRRQLGGEGVINWSKLTMNCTKKLLKWEWGFQKFGKIAYFVYGWFHIACQHQAFHFFIDQYNIVGQLMDIKVRKSKKHFLILFNYSIKPNKKSCLILS